MVPSISITSLCIQSITIFSTFRTTRIVRWLHHGKMIELMACFSHRPAIATTHMFVGITLQVRHLVATSSFSELLAHSPAN